MVHCHNNQQVMYVLFPESSFRMYKSEQIVSQGVV